MAWSQIAFKAKNQNVRKAIAAGVSLDSFKTNAFLQTNQPFSAGDFTQSLRQSVIGAMEGSQGGLTRRTILYMASRGTLIKEWEPSKWRAHAKPARMVAASEN